MKKIEIAPAIYLYEDVFEPGDIISLVNQECSESWGYVGWAKTEVGSRNTVRDDYRSAMGCNMRPLAIDPSAVAVERIIPLVTAWREIVLAVQDAIHDYRADHILELEKDEGFTVLKYGRGAQYKGHVDHAPQNQRILSLSGFLNDDYSGGELVFPLFDVKVKPKTGSVLLFPSNFPYYHYVEPVGIDDERIRYSFVTWLS